MFMHVLYQLVVLDPAAGGDGIIPNAPPALPDGLSVLVGKLIGWAKGLVMVAGVLGLLGSAAMMVVGRRRSHQMATDGLIGTLWAVAGLAVASVATVLVSAVWM